MESITAEPSSRVNEESGAAPLQLFSTCPQSSQHGKDYLQRLIQVARWSERAGCTGSLIYTDNSLADAWLVAQVLIQNTESLCPLVAVQPVYMHPYSVAKMVSTLGRFYGRRVFLNMVAGGFKNDLAALNDTTPHDRRYERLVAYTKIIQRLLDGGPVTMDGEFYRVNQLTLAPALAPDLKGDILMSGSSEAGIAAARETGAIAIKYPEPPESIDALPAAGLGRCGARVGIVTRPQEEDAWAVAFKRFPSDRKGKITRQLAAKVSDSAWHKRLSEMTDAQPEQPTGTYWLHPFEHYHTNCPYLVGSYQNVTTELAKYMRLGYSTFILDIPTEEEEFDHIRTVFDAASRQAGTRRHEKSSYGEAISA